MVSISKSRLNTFDHCQMQFKFLYIDGLETEESFLMSEGTKFHEWSSELDKKLKDLKDEKTIREYLNSLLNNPTRSDWEKYYLNFELDLLARCLSEKKEKWRDYFHPLYCEFKFEKEIEGNKWRCICDRIYKTFSDEFLLMEIKTGKADLKGVRRELAISKILIDSVLNVEIGYFGIINPNLKITQTEKVKKITISSTKKAITKFIEIVNSGIFKKSEFWCGTCEHSERCYNFSFFK